MSEQDMKDTEGKVIKASKIIKRSKKNKKNDKSEEIKNRESWLKIVVIFILVMVVAYKILTSNSVLDLSKFDFSSLLSVIIAIFSIGLSVAFYFKASDTSNLFYDNTYKFTKNMSEILGRIEATFGEKFDNLNNGYCRIEKMIASPTEIEEGKREIEENKKQVDIHEDEKEKIINEYAIKTRLEKEDFKEVIRQLEEKSNAVEKYKSNIEYLKEKLEQTEDNVQGDAEAIRHSRLELKHMLMDNKVMLDNLRNTQSYELLKAKFYPYTIKFNKYLLNNLYLAKYIDSEKNLTIAGTHFLVDMINRVVRVKNRTINSVYNA